MKSSKVTEKKNVLKKNASSASKASASAKLPAAKAKKPPVKPVTKAQTAKASVSAAKKAGDLPAGSRLQVTPYADKATYYVKVTSPKYQSL